MTHAKTGGGKKPSGRARRPGADVDPIEQDFGPGESAKPPAAEGAAPPSPATGPVPGIACAGENCLLKPAADLVGRFTFSLAGRAALGRAAFSGVALLKALRDFLDEEIALAERAAGKGENAEQHYEKIKVE
ncbi:MAG: hypothetical protein ACHQPI_00035 [Thermoanaerobaculia bacterium]